VRTYRLQIRVIQLSVLITLIVMIFGLVNVWQSSVPGQQTGENGTTQGSSGSNPDNTETGDNNASPNGDGVIEGNGTPINSKIVCLGDSFTYGYPGEPKDSWPERIAGILKIEVINAGKVYQNAEDLLVRFDQDVVDAEPGRVVIFAGVGDALREKPLEEYQKYIKALVEKAEANHIKPVLALPIPYPGTDERYQAYREWEITYAQEKSILVLDFKDVLFDSDGKILRKYSDDGKYPNKDGYQAMGDYAARVLQ